jgi:hypothetical protein
MGLCGRGPEQSKTRSQFFGEQRGLFKGGEMAAPVQLVPVNELRITSFRPASWCLIDLMWKDAATYWQLHHAAICIEIFIFVVDSRRRGGRAGQPVKRDVVQHLIER